MPIRVQINLILPKVSGRARPCNANFSFLTESDPILPLFILRFNGFQYIFKSCLMSSNKHPFCKIRKWMF